MAANTVLMAAKAAGALRSRKVQAAIGIALLSLSVLLTLPMMMGGAILSALYAAINPSVTGRLEDDLHWQVIQEIKAELAIENDLHVSTLKVIDLEHHHDFLKDRSEIREYLLDNFIITEQIEVPMEVGDVPVPGQTDDTKLITVHRFKTPDEIMTMLSGAPFHFDAETLEAIRELVYTPPTTEELHYTGKFPMPCSGYITSPYGERIDPITGESSWHKGIDIVPAHHAPLKAIAEGTVARVNLGGEIYGSTITIKHVVDGETFYTYYAHCSSIARSVGDTVRQGEVVAYEGGASTDPSPGRSTGHHLHFEIRLTLAGNQVNPMEYLSGN